MDNTILMKKLDGPMLDINMIGLSGSTQRKKHPFTRALRNYVQGLINSTTLLSTQQDNIHPSLQSLITMG